MRNLKKVLSLALALVMLLGMMVVGAGAATSFKDDDKIDNQVAVAVSNKIGVLVGDENGNFNPDGTLTRAEAAVAIARLDLGTSAANALAATNAATFKDVPVTHWGKPYIDYCAGNGYIVGDGNGNFNPNKTVTSVEFATMVSRMLGYDTKVEGIEGNADWAVKAAALARKAGLSTNVLLTTVSAMTRDDMAQMVFNSLTSPLVEYEGLNVSINGVSLTSNVKVRTHATDTGNNNTTYNNERIQANITPIRLCEEKFPDLKLSTAKYDSFGRPQSVWTWKQVNIAGSETTYADDANSHTDDAPDTKAAIDADTTTFVNGKQVANPAKLSNLAANGRLVQVYYWDNDQSSIYRITAIDTFVARVVSVNSDKGTVTVTPLTGHTPEDKPALLNKTFKTTGFSAGDIVTYKAAWNKTDGKYDIKEMKALTDPATGTLTAWRGTNVIEAGEKGGDKKDFTVDGNTYEYSYANYVADMEGNKQTSGVAGFAVNKDQINVYVDEYGFAIYVSGVEAEKNYAAVIGVGDSNTHGSKTVGVTLLFPDGTQKEVTAKFKNVATRTTGTNPATAPSNKSADGTVTTEAQLVNDPIADVVSYRVDDNGVYELTILGYTETATSDAGSYTGKYYTRDSATITGGGDTPAASNELNLGKITGARAGNDGASFTNGKSEFKVGTATLYANSKTIFMVCTGDDTKGYNYNVYTGYQEMPSLLTSGDYLGITGIAYGTRNTYSKQLDIVYIYAKAVSGMSASNTYFVVEKDQTIYTDSTGSYMVVNAIVDGEETTVKVSTACTPAVTEVSDGSTVAKPGLYLATNVIKNRNDIITSFNTASMSSGEGTVKPDRVVLGIDGNEATATYFAYNDKTQVIMVPEDFKSISLIPMDSVLTDTNDQVWYSFADSDSKVLKDVVIWEQDNTATYTVAGNTGYKLSETTTAGDFKSAGTNLTRIKEGTTVYVKADDNYTIDVAATAAKGVTLTAVAGSDGVYSFVVTGNITNDKIVTKSTLGSPYSSEVDETITTGLSALNLKTAANNQIDNGKLKLHIYGGGDEIQQIKDALAAQGYEITDFEKTTNSAAKTEYTIKVVKGGVKETVTCCTKSGTPSEVDVTKYWIADINDAKQYIANGAQPAAIAQGTSKGTGFAVSTDGGTTWAYDKAYTNQPTAITADTVIKSGYIKAAVTDATSAVTNLFDVEYKVGTTAITASSATAIPADGVLTVTLKAKSAVTLAGTANAKLGVGTTVPASITFTLATGSATINTPATGDNAIDGTPSAMAADDTIVITYAAANATDFTIALDWTAAT